MSPFDAVPRLNSLQLSAKHRLHVSYELVFLRVATTFKEMGLGELVSKPTLMLGDNKQACRWSRTEMVTNGNKFIERQYHKVREFILANSVH